MPRLHRRPQNAAIVPLAGKNDSRHVDQNLSLSDKFYLDARGKIRHNDTVVIVSEPYSVISTFGPRLSLTPLALHYPSHIAAGLSSVRPDSLPTFPRKEQDTQNGSRRLHTENG